jgi:hypothetical protein
MRKAIVVLVGLMLAIGGVTGPPRSEAADACSLNGTYILSGLGEAAGFLEVVGSLSFTPNGACTSGTLGGAVTIRHQGAAPTPFTPFGTYSVDPSGTVTASVPGVIDLVGVISLVTSSDQVANSIHLVVTFTGPQVLALTATRNTPTAGLQVLNRSIAAVGVNSTTTETTVYSFTVAGGTLGTDKKLRGEMFANYNNLTGGPRTLTIRLKYGGNTFAVKTVTIGSPANPATLYIEFFLANSFGSTASNRGGFTGVVDDTCNFNACAPGAVQGSFGAVGHALTDSTVAQSLQITIQHGAADTSLEKQYAILELL